jgi:hypothetical protein
VRHQGHHGGEDQAEKSGSGEGLELACVHGGFRGNGEILRCALGFAIVKRRTRRCMKNARNLMLNARNLAHAGMGLFILAGEWWWPN